MRNRNWSRVQPLNALHAIKLCNQYARDKRNLSIPGIENKMGVKADKVYDWQSDGNLPVRLILNYEEVCGVHFISRWLAQSAGYMTIRVPTGRKSQARDINSLQELLTEAVGQIIKFAAGKAEANDVLGAIQTGMEALAWHRVNVEKHQQPEFDFGGDDEH
ncbi:helix-turn-helix domain-containing protein [Methylococcus mesophilus]|uniref:hypothetical protein n=1 Tax=Methylococcus mesophilus TaxID=2993564 RepID=UPI00224A79D1|nr:hypothetical protein [Methylococcus mesophilus]UZR27464.1 hypothetical protein OOT43_12040 [Methylococcus mesophilus]